MEQIDPITGLPIPNRAGAPNRSINDLSNIGSIQDPGMMSARRAEDFQKFNNIAQYTPPPVMKMEDLSGDGKVTMKDVLIGRGVIDKQGNKTK